MIFGLTSNYETVLSTSLSHMKLLLLNIASCFDVSMLTNFVVQLFFRTILIYVSIHSGLRSSLTAVAS